MTPEEDLHRYDLTCVDSLGTFQGTQEEKRTQDKRPYPYRYGRIGCPLPHLGPDTLEGFTVYLKSSLLGLEKG